MCCWGKEKDIFLSFQVRCIKRFPGESQSVQVDHNPQQQQQQHREIHYSVGQQKEAPVYNREGDELIVPRENEGARIR